MLKKFGFVVFAAVLVGSIFTISPSSAAGPAAGFDGAVPPVRTGASAVADSEPSRGYGIANSLYLSLSSAGFRPYRSTTTYLGGGDGYTYATGGDGWFWAPVTLPAGAYLDGIWFFYYDNSASDVGLWFERFYGSTVPDTETIIGSHFSTGTPGYTYEYVPVGHTIRYYGNYDSYAVWAYLTEQTSNQMFKGVRFEYHLQISAAPSIATFSDVPTTHPFFQYIEALYDAGITTGYSGTTLFGPNDYVTRGQMAAFLSRALGLQWY